MYKLALNNNNIIFVYIYIFINNYTINFLNHYFDALIAFTILMTIKVLIVTTQR